MEKGTYALIIALKRETTITVGKLGRRGGENEIAFPAGYYIYVGSARGGLYPRVSRHLREGKRLRWHIDYLLEHAKVAEVWWTEDSQECLWACAAKGMPHARILVPGFGSSDCRCPAHLIYFPSLPSFELFQKALGEKGAQLKRTNPGEFLNP
ncbi:MAG: GIY-YIG nuclease family protein [Dehalococcoidia bacterium]|nr:GIY-YIG nuclease family protein [Dehalococcoidia bacterium]